MEGGERQRLETALRWLRSHHKRLSVDRRSLEGQLTTLVSELERLEQEIERAERRLASRAE